MLKTKHILVILIVLFAIFLVCKCQKKKEGYANVFYNKDLDPTTLARSSFNSNLDPRNMNMRFDPNVYGGYIKGAATPVDNLASYNQIPVETKGVKEGFDLVVPNISDQTQGAVYNGQYIAGMNDAASYVTRPDSSYESINVGQSISGTSNSDYGSIGGDFASLAGAGTFQAAKQANATQKYKMSLDNRAPDTLKYTTPQELLPAPDMRQPLMRDPSDPSNFMYDRTLFAPLKKRNLNEADRFRGDLDIQPIKTGWFDIATVPHVDLVKGYMGYYNDITEYQDIQDIAYSRQQSDAQGEDNSANTQKMTAVMSAINQDMMKPSLKYATAPVLNYGPLEGSYTRDNPWYDTNSGRIARGFDL